MNKTSDDTHSIEMDEIETKSLIDGNESGREHGHDAKVNERTLSRQFKTSKYLLFLTLFTGFFLRVLFDNILISKSETAHETAAVTSSAVVTSFAAGPPPLLTDILDARNHKIVGDVSWLLDFAVVDFAKCGTTYLMHYFGIKSVDTYVHDSELCYMSKVQPYKLVEEYYDKATVTNDGRKILLGLKCPEDLETEFGIANYHKYFPNTKLIVSMRHPVWYFQSYYNYRAYNNYPQKMPKTTHLVGLCEEDSPYVPWYCGKDCPSGNQNVCTARANFHHALSRLGKTPMSTPEEANLLQHEMTIFRTRNKVFLMELRQLDANMDASKYLARDLKDFLGLKHDLEPLKDHRAAKVYENKKAAKHLINICDDEHAEVRLILIQIGKNSAQWITKYFLQSQDVFVSSRDKFVELLEDWQLDPCLEEN